jgi:hypothetical protein
MNKVMIVHQTAVPMPDFLKNYYPHQAYALCLLYYLKPYCSFSFFPYPEIGKWW